MNKKNVYKNIFKLPVVVVEGFLFKYFDATDLYASYEDFWSYFLVIYENIQYKI